MMRISKETRTGIARDILQAFAQDTGIDSHGISSAKRYLWTDALGVECFLALHELSGTQDHLNQALQLIDLVHLHLGRYHPDDRRTGWISGIPEKRALQHPTAGGLRIGKRFPQSLIPGDLNQVDEWDRDGQYFHYNMKWIEALLLTHRVTGELKFARWAAELLEASSRFLSYQDSEIRIYWKMNTDLTRPLLLSQGLLDPLDGLITSLQILEIFPDKRGELNYLLGEFRSLCNNAKWETWDPLTAAGLLQIALKATMLEDRKRLKPVTCSQLFRQAFKNLDNINSRYDTGPAENRLAFRECGLSLAINLLKYCSEIAELKQFPRSHLQAYLQLAMEIEEFWLEEYRQKAGSWTAHQPINSVSLAASLLAMMAPGAFLNNSRNKKTEAG